MLPRGVSSTVVGCATVEYMETGKFVTGKHPFQVIGMFRK